VRASRSLDRIGGRDAILETNRYGDVPTERYEFAALIDEGDEEVGHAVRKLDHLAQDRPQLLESDGIRHRIRRHG
jgi:hypothetical protein